MAVQYMHSEIPKSVSYEHVNNKMKNNKRATEVAGCVPQGSRDLKEIEGVSIVGVQQIDLINEVVEETLRGHEVRLLNRKALPVLDLPKPCWACETVIVGKVKEIWLSSEDTGAFGTH